MTSPSSEPAEAAAAGQSFTTMDKGDVEAIGAHCQFSYCHQLDFLPFKCESCKGTFCLDHRTEFRHDCPNPGAWAAARRAKTGAPPRTLSSSPTSTSTSSLSSPCAHSDCKTVINTPLVTGVHCTNCNRHYCLKHRLREAHSCNTLTPLGARPGTTNNSTSPLQTDRAKQAIARLKAWGAAKQSSLLSSSSSSSSSPNNSTSTTRKPTTNNNKNSVAALATLKRTAKGDASIPPSSRIYLHVEASSTSTTSKFPSGAFFYPSAWSVGRVLDAAAKALQVENLNNRGRGEEDRLRVFHVEAGRLLDFAEKVGEAAGSGNTLVLLRGVGPPNANPSSHGS
ncbi:MAG: hypothetical protein M1837_005237 [Sclerophora amabilis]|nr:MAG: hypothetical protein M1837_005237 [Sclerophora amabilis]